MENKEGNIKKNFSVPADYFDQLEQQILSKTVDAPKVNTNNKIYKPWMAIAASVLIIFSITAAWMWNANDSASRIADETEVDYLEGMEDELFAALMFDEDGADENNSLTELADFLVELENDELSE